MNQLLQMTQKLTYVLSTDPILCLAQAAAWLNPIGDQSFDEWEDNGSDHDEILYTALIVLRDAFPDLPDDPDAETVFLKLRELRNSW